MNLGSDSGCVGMYRVGDEGRDLCKEGCRYSLSQDGVTETCTTRAIQGSERYQGMKGRKSPQKGLRGILLNDEK